MIKYECAVCGYVYNPVLAERTGLPRDTQFEDIPDDWCCPQCGTKKKYFVAKSQETKKE
ncbi:rubredoxin [Desulfonatronovibrio magnus]|uniref:rubredoxin n=1 Tax=Desulfonatronovibrio magnus TaxID=698827 RepID=UPI0009FC8BC7|nr:rubredoxin [Desulfonatronovibrio magnus]